MTYRGLLAACWFIILPSCVDETHNLTPGGRGGAGGDSGAAASCGDGEACAGQSGVRAGGTGGRAHESNTGGVAGTPVVSAGSPNGSAGAPVGAAGSPGSGSKCAGLGEKDCRARSDCRSLTAVGGRFYGCIRDQMCGDAETCATNGTDVVTFTTTCLPGDFEEVPFERCSPDSCAGLAQQECEKTAGCRAPVSNDGQYWGCESVRGCDGALTLTCAQRGTDGPVAEFPDTCLPTGFTAVDDALCSSVSQCADLDEEACRANTACTPLADTEGTYRGCMRDGTGCGALMTCASNGYVTTMFSSTCIPAGYEARPSSECGGGCPELADTECVLAEECRAILSSDGVFRGCEDSDRSCPASVTCGISPTGEVAEFGDCLPYGWLSVETSECAREAECAKLASAADCEDAAGCMTIRSSDLTFYYCAASRGCGQMLTTAWTAATGQCETFASTCLPPGWIASAGDGPCQG